MGKTDVSLRLAPVGLLLWLDWGEPSARSSGIIIVVRLEWGHAEGTRCSLLIAFLAIVMVSYLLKGFLLFFRP